MIRRLIRTIIFLIILAGVAFGVYMGVVNRWFNVNYVFVNGMVRGVDISSYQGDVDMDKLKSQEISFVYIKATEGSSYRDERFKENWAAAKVAGLPAGAYHFFSYESSGATQAENYINAVGSLDGRLIPAVDMELSSEQKLNPPEKADLVTALKTFLAILEEKYRVKPVIYATKDYYDKYLAEDFSEYPRWVRSVFWPVYIEAGSDWLIWQFDDHGDLDGYLGKEQHIDLNVLNKEFGLDALRYK